MISSRPYKRGCRVAGPAGRGKRAGVPKRQTRANAALAAPVESEHSPCLSVGDRVPDAPLTYFDTEGVLQQISPLELCQGQKVVLFAVPGAFLPTCSMKHLPGFLDKEQELKERGVDVVACISVNDPFVMDAWGKSLGVGERIMMLSDGSAKFAKAMGAELDLSDKNAGVRSRRYAMIIKDQIIEVLNLEEGGGYTISSAEDVLERL